MPVTLLKRLFTVQEYHKMIAAQVLSQDDRVELIRGEIVQMSPIGPRQAAAVKRLAELFMFRLVGKVTIGIQDPVELNENSEPQPDISIVQRRTDFYETKHPDAADVFLLVEVGDTTVKSDREIKIPLYAETNISEVWLVNLDEYCLEIYRKPSGKGYQSVQRLEEGQNASIQAIPDVVFTVDELLG